MSLIILVLSGNIIKRRRAEKILKASEQKFKDLTETTSDCVWEVDDKWVYTYVSPRISDLTGFIVSELIGKTPFNFMPPVEAHKKAMNFQQLMSLEKPLHNIEKINIHKNGSEIVIETNATPIFNDQGKLSGYRGIDRDITERKKIEELNNRRLECEKTISAISSRFVGQFDIDIAIDNCLSDIGRLANASRAYVFLLRENSRMDNAYEWCPPGVVPQKKKLQDLPLDSFPWWTEKLKENKIIQIDDVSKLPEQANLEKQEFAKQNIKSMLALPFSIDSELAGFIGFDNVTRTGPWEPEDLLLLQVSAQIISNALKRKRAEEKLLHYQVQLKSLASELAITEERERRRIATELHDRISQALVISKMMVEQLRENEQSDHIAGVLDDVGKLLGQTIETSRLLTFDLSSPILYELGFEAAVSEWLADQIERKHKIMTVFEDDGEPKPMGDDIRALLFRMVRELLINVVKHARAKKVRVSLNRLDTRLNICVEDNGIGFDPAKTVSMGPATGGFGLFSIRERLEQLGGSFVIKSSPGCGCKVVITAPLKVEDN